MEAETPKRKRGRPPKAKLSPLVKPPCLPLPGLPDAPATNPSPPATELQHGYQILKAIMKMPKVRPFLDRPNKNLFGLHNYHKVIKNPMWLSEVSRKFVDHEYKTITEFLSDMTLMLKNCYKFWGPYHKFTKMGLRIEAMLQQQLKNLPEHIKNVLPEEYKDIKELSPEEPSPPADLPKKEFISKIMIELDEENEVEIIEPEVPIEVQELKKWEKEVFGSKHNKKCINTIPLLPDIGQFLKLSCNVLDVDEITQYEIERMLLMPKESNSLATVMTTMLCPYAVRGNLFLKPVMCYEVWSEILKKKVDHWYNIYYKLINPIEVFETSGIEPHFWVSMGEINPLCEGPFHELSLFQRAWLLKALCSYTFHSNKRVETLFNTVHEDCLRPQYIWEDTTYQYFTLFSPEIRVYRQKKTTDIAELAPCDPDIDSLDGGKIESLSSDDLKHTGKFKYFPPSCLLPRKKEFCLMAYSSESLDSLMTSMKKKKTLINFLQSYDREKHTEITLRGLQSMYKQWMAFKERLQGSVDQSIDYWISKNTAPLEFSEPLRTIQEYELIPEVPLPPIVAVAPIVNPNPNPNDQLIVLGKRVQKKRILSADETSLSEQEEGSDENSNVSDWEEGNIKKKTKRKRRPLTRNGFRKDIREEVSQYLLSKGQHFGSNEGKLRKLGVTILKTRAANENTKRSIVAAAVANANNIAELANRNEVLTISLKNRDVSVSKSVSAEASTLRGAPLTVHPPNIPYQTNSSPQLVGPSFPNNSDPVVVSINNNKCFPPPHIKPTNVEGKLSLGIRQDGTFGYRILLPDGGVIMLSNEEVIAMRARNGGSYPEKVVVPMLKYV